MEIQKNREQCCAKNTQLNKKRNELKAQLEMLDQELKELHLTENTQIRTGPLSNSSRDEIEGNASHHSSSGSARGSINNLLTGQMPQTGNTHRDNDTQRSSEVNIFGSNKRGAPTTEVGNAYQNRNVGESPNEKIQHNLPPNNYCEPVTQLLFNRQDGNGEPLQHLHTQINYAFHEQCVPQLRVLEPAQARQETWQVPFPGYDQHIPHIGSGHQYQDHNENLQFEQNGEHQRSKPQRLRNYQEQFQQQNPHGQLRQSDIKRGYYGDLGHNRPTIRTKFGANPRDDIKIWADQVLSSLSHIPDEILKMDIVSKAICGDAAVHFNAIKRDHKQ